LQKRNRGSGREQEKYDGGGGGENDVNTGGAKQENGHDDKTGVWQALESTLGVKATGGQGGGPPARGLFPCLKFRASDRSRENELGKEKRWNPSRGRRKASFLGRPRRKNGKGKLKGEGGVGKGV